MTLRYRLNMADGEVFEKAIDSSFEICHKPSRGRGINTRRFLAKGTCVLSSEPYAFVSSSEKHGKICDSCLACAEVAVRPRRCSACKTVYYCSQMCQKNAWKTHKQECKYLQKLFPIVPSDTVRLLGLLLLKNDSENVLRDLVSHSEEIRQDKSEVFAYVLEILKKYLGGGMEWSSEKIFELFCKLHCNAFTICDGELRPIGLGIYQTLAFLNHSCEPNCIAVFNSRTCEIRSIKNIEKGEELCISYTELMRPQSVRGKVLKEQYYFDCTCSRCLKEIGEGTEMNGLRCVNKDCFNAVGFHSDNLDTTLDKSCSECGSNIPDNHTSQNITKLYEKIDTTLSSACDMMKQSEKLSETLSMCEDLLTEVQKTLHDFNYQVIRVLDKVSDICIELGVWNKAIHYCKKSLDGCLKFYPKYHPSTAIQLYRIGKLEIYLDKLDAGLSSLSQARVLLEVCYGKQHSLTKQLGELILQTVQEKNLSEQLQRSMIKQ